MLEVRRATDRGLGDHGWLKSRHSFSFADYYDPERMGFGDLRVINEDRIEGGTGFPTHGHRDMEIISYVISGGLEHQDSMGNKTRILPGEVQRMSAGTGVSHSEYNAFQDRPTHFMQIWIQPERRGLKPGYGQKSFEDELKEKNLVLVVSRSGREGSIEIAQDADLYLSRSSESKTIQFEVRQGRRIWLQMIQGEVAIRDLKLSAGDGLATDESRILEINTIAGAEFMLFDLHQ